MIVKAFVDTNILLYLASRNPIERSKKTIAARIVSTEEIGFSAQVMQEFYTVAVQKADFGLSPAEALTWLETLEEFPCAAITPSLVKTAALLSVKFKISYWAAAIIAASEALGASIVYTEALSHGQTYGTVTAVNPFLPPKSTSSFHEAPEASFVRD